MRKEKLMNLIYWTNTVIAICTYVLSELDFQQVFGWWVLVNSILWFTLDRKRYNKIVTLED